MKRSLLGFVLVIIGLPTKAFCLDAHRCSRRITVRSYVRGSLGLTELGLGVEGLFLQGQLGGVPASEKLARFVARHHLRELAYLTANPGLTLVEATDLLRERLVWLDMPFLYSLAGSTLLVHGSGIFQYLLFRSLIRATVFEAEENRTGPALERLRAELLGASNGVSSRYLTKRKYDRAFSAGERRDIETSLNEKESKSFRLAIESLISDDSLCGSTKSAPKIMLMIADRLLRFSGL